VTWNQALAQSVICAIDDSRASRRAVEAATWLAWELDARLVLAHAFDPMASRMTRGHARTVKAGREGPMLRRAAGRADDAGRIIAMRAISGSNGRSLPLRL
jgi:hypothetical protein